MQDPFSGDSRGKKRPVPLFHEPPRRIQQEVVPGHAPRTPWEDLVRRGREIERRVLARGVRRTSKTDGRWAATAAWHQSRLAQRAPTARSPVLRRSWTVGSTSITVLSEGSYGTRITGIRWHNRVWVTTKTVVALTPGILGNEHPPPAHMDRRSRKVL